MSLQFIIDGYNMINHPQFKCLNKRSKDQKSTLLNFIKSHRLTGSPKNKITIVFDGYPRAEGFKNTAEFIFSRNETADEKIKRIVEESGNTSNIVVVSDDKEIKFLVKSLGAKTMGIEEFIGTKEITQRKKREETDIELTYVQMEKINQELRKIWLK